MTDRLTTLAVALSALALFLLLFVHGEGGLDRRMSVPRPTSAESRGNGYRAAFLWLRASGLRTESLRERMDSLSARRDLAAEGNVLLVTLPGTETYKPAEVRWLQRWIRAGNTLIVLAALGDNPDWSDAVGGVNVADLNALSGLLFNIHGVAGARRGGQERPPALVLPNRAHAYFTHAGRALAAAGPAQEDWSVRLPLDTFMLALAHERDTGRAVLWTRLSGSGRIVVCAVASLFSDAALPLADNAQLFANVIDASLGRRGTVIFDDFHHGLSVLYDPEKFYRDPRLYLTIAVLLALWLTWVLGATRLRIPRTRVAAPREGDLVRAHGGFLARVLSSDLAARRLIELLLRRVARRMPARAVAEDPWDLLQSSSRTQPSDLAQLRRWYAQAGAGARVPLARLHNLILRMQREVA